jgi:hypothetical protein
MTQSEFTEMNYQNDMAAEERRMEIREWEDMEDGIVLLREAAIIVSMAARADGGNTDAIKFIRKYNAWARRRR